MSVKNPTPKQKYRELCEQEPSIPIFSQAWWLDSVAGDAWDVVLVEKGDTIQASLPFVVQKRHGFTVLTMPQLTQTLGPWLKPSTAKYAKQLAQEKDLIQELFDKLPPHAMYAQNWHYSKTNWLPLYWKGYSQTTRYTYVIHLDDGIESVWSSIDSSYRNKVRKAEKIVKVCENLNITEFYKINEKTFFRQGIMVPYNLAFIINHHKILSEHNSSKIFYAIDENRQIHSALYLTWDKLCSYVHMVGEDPELRNSGAGILLIWEAIKFTYEKLKLKRFDFEGSMLEPVERVRRDFGAIQTPYFAISKTNSKMLKAYQALRNILR